MKDEDIKQLFKELKSETINSKEADELFSLVGRLSEYPKLERSFKVKRRFLEGNIKQQKGSYIPRWFFIPAISFVLLLFLGGGAVVASQKSIPGDPLYPVKRVSEKMISSVTPSFEEKIMIRRSEEVKRLVEKEGKPDLIKETVNDYKETVENNKVGEESREKSRENIREAIKKASEEEREELKEIIEEKREVLGQDDKKDQPEQDEPSESREGNVREKEKGNIRTHLSD